LYQINSTSVPVFSIKSIIAAVISSDDFFDDVLTKSTYNGELFNDITSGYLFHSHFADCDERDIIPLHVHLFYDEVSATRKQSVGPLYIRFLNMRSRFNRETLYLLSYTAKTDIDVINVLPHALKEIEILNNKGKRNNEY